MRVSIDVLVRFVTDSSNVRVYSSCAAGARYTTTEPLPVSATVGDAGLNPGNLLSPTCRHVALVQVPVEPDPSRVRSRSASTRLSAPARAPRVVGTWDAAVPLVIRSFDPVLAPAAAVPLVMRIVEPPLDLAVPLVMRTVELMAAVPDCDVPRVTRIVDATG